jgi:hypothetical protein
MLEEKCVAGVISEGEMAELLAKDAQGAQLLEKILQPAAEAAVGAVEGRAVAGRAVEGGADPAQLDDSMVKYVCAAEYVEHDSYAAFDAIMQRLVGLYHCEDDDIDEDETTGAAERGANTDDEERKEGMEGRGGSSREGRDYGSGAQQHQRGGDHGSKVLSLSQQCEQYRDLLQRVDPLLSRHLHDHLKVQPEIYLIRWLRLLTAREFGQSIFKEQASGSSCEAWWPVWEIWDAIFAISLTDFSYIKYVCVAMVRQLRNELLELEQHDQPAALSLLLRFDERVSSFCLSPSSGPATPRPALGASAVDTLRGASTLRDAVAAARASELAHLPSPMPSPRRGGDAPGIPSPSPSEANTQIAGPRPSWSWAKLPRPRVKSK